MIRKGLIIFVLVFFVSCKTTPFVEIKSHKNAYLIRTNKSIGEVFTENFETDEIDKSLERFTPTIDEINQAENILKLDFKKSNKNTEGRFISRNLNDYKRQYLGFINSTGDKMLHISFYLNKNRKNQNDELWQEGYMFIFDGGTSYWIAIINLKTKKVEKIAINGVA